MNCKEWQKDFNLNEENIDSQHKTLFTLLKEISTLSESKDPCRSKSVAREFRNHIIEHFAYEEQLMKASKFPGYFSHKMEHDRLVKKYGAILGEIIDGKNYFSTDMPENIYNWFCNHLELNDKKLAKHLKTV